MAASSIQVRGARQHNLRDIDVDLPHNQLIVVCGVSGSGKSSLAFDTVFAEGQRRYVESLSTYARQFLGQLDKPDYDSIRGLAPTIAVKQRTARGSPRSTVGTLTGILDHLRVLFARVGIQHCTGCGQPVQAQSAAQIVDQLVSLPTGTRIDLLSPVLRGQSGAFTSLLNGLRRDGFSRIRVDGHIHRLDDLTSLDEGVRHDLDVLVDRVRVEPERHARLADSVETALQRGAGTLIVAFPGDAKRTDRLLSEHHSCPDCDLSFPELTPASFSFNSPRGMCPDCKGLGTVAQMDPTRVVPDPSLSIRGGAIAPWAKMMRKADSWNARMVAAVAERLGFDLETPWQELPKEARDALLYGLDGERMLVEWAGRTSKGSREIEWEGAITAMTRRMHQTSSEGMRQMYQSYMSQQTCGTCHGERFSRASAAVRVGPWTLSRLGAEPVSGVRAALRGLALGPTEATIAHELLRELDSRLGFLEDVGLGYPGLDRRGDTLSGGEAQRIRLASQLGGELTGVTYVLDEPSIGLHARDAGRLVATLGHLRDLGNTVLVVEHDADTIRAADHLVELGPGAGAQGGQVVFAGSPSALAQATATDTGRYLAGAVPLPRRQRPPADRHLHIRGARHHNLQDIDVDLPLGRLVVVSGVSGAGKSSLVQGILAPALHNVLHGAQRAVGACDDIRGIDQLTKIIDIDQSPIGRTPRSNPATYTKLFDLIRAAFARTPEARVRGFTASRFSFNSKGGRCEACKGDGRKKVEMHFLADVYVPCAVCDGTRFNAATLAVKYRGHDISEVLNQSVDEARDLFANLPKPRRILDTLQRVGLGYIRLGQPAHTLSGGEAQRVKLARELARPTRGSTLFMLDEPTTGLHFADVYRLVEILQALVDGGDSVLVVEHDIDVIACADHIIDLGPDGGDGGGQLVVAGTPEAVADHAGSATAPFLRRRLSQDRRC